MKNNQNVHVVIGGRGYGKTYLLKQQFQKNQRKIDNRKTSKEERKQLIIRNKEILEELNESNKHN